MLVYAPQATMVVAGQPVLKLYRPPPKLALPRQAKNEILAHAYCCYCSKLCKFQRSLVVRES